MAFFDNSLLLSNAQAVTVTAASTSIYDITGAGSGVAPSQIWGTSTSFGADIGNGDGSARPTAFFAIGTTFTGATNMQVSVQAAPDNGSNAPGTYVTLTETGVMLEAALTAGTTFSLPIPGVPSNFSGLPRFYRFYYTVTGTHGAGAITGGILLNPPDQLNKKYPANFVAV